MVIMKRVLATVLFMAFTAITLAGDPPTVKLEATAQFKRDSKIVLKVQGIDENLKARVKWWIRSDEGKASPDSEVFNDGRSCAVWGIPGKYEALVTIGVPDADTIHWIDIEHKFIIGEASPTPGPTPPSPVPTPTPSNFGDVISEVIKFAESVRDDDKAGGAKIIAKAYRDNAALAVKGDFGTPQALADATSSQLVYDLGMGRYLHWRPMQSKLREHMVKLHADGKLKDNDMKSWALLWEEYAKGFDSVAVKGGTDAATPSPKK